MKKISKSIKVSIFTTLILIITFLILETSSRILYSLVSYNLKALKYGFDPKIKLQINSIKKFSFSTIDNNLDVKLKLSKDNKEIKGNKIDIWVFGGSTSDVACRHVNETSWPVELGKLNKDLKITNFAKSGTNSDFAINLLLSKIDNSNNLPKIILWANYANEQDVIFWGLNRNQKKISFHNKNTTKNKIIYKFNSLTKTLNENSVFFYLFYDVSKKILENFFPNFAFKILRTDKIANENDYNVAIENYNINTIEAFSVSKKIKSEFFIVTLAAIDDFSNKNKSIFYNKYFKKNLDKLKSEKNINLINTKEMKFNIKNFDKLYCDNIHFTNEGNKYISNQIFDELLKKSNLF